MSLPTFKYNPNPVALNVISKEKTTCPVCKLSKNVNTYMKILSNLISIKF
ncbi:CbrC family protein [Bacillus atrophaeus]|nr:CbrC family protein [Bacillus atrophaeus]MCY8807796.1 CbrC family protein [Bacillus atrophaeus]